jgi:hypothetical protein
MSFFKFSKTATPSHSTCAVVCRYGACNCFINLVNDEFKKRTKELKEPENEKEEKEEKEEQWVVYEVPTISLPVKHRSIQIFELPNETRYSLFPWNEHRTTMLIVGKPGAGKTFLIRNLGLQYQFKERQKEREGRVIVITSKIEDPTLEIKTREDMLAQAQDSLYELNTVNDVPYSFNPGKLDMLWMTVTNENYLEFDWETLRDTFRDSLVIFDDCQFSDLKIDKQLRYLRDATLKLGRQQNTSVIATLHVLLHAVQAQYRNACSEYVFFPQNGFERHIKAFWNEYNVPLSIQSTLLQEQGWVYHNFSRGKLFITQNSIFFY